MKIFKALVSLAFVFLTAISVFAQSSGKTYVEGELLVKFKSGTTSSFAAQANSEIGAKVLEEFADLGWQRVQLPKNLSVEAAIARYANLADVAAAQPNFYYHLLTTPNDPQFGSLYGMTKISAPSAWDLTTGSSAVVVANIDTGARYTHQDLAANMWTNPGEINGNSLDDDGNGFIDDFYGYDFRYNDSDPLDQNGHGTHTSGTIGAVGNNSLGVAGVNWNVRIMTIKIYSPSGTDTTAAMLINAYNYVRLMKNRGVNIRVTNNSYGGCLEACGYDQATKDALDAMGNAGILNVFAAGNSGTNNDVSPHYPSNYTSPSILAVAGSNASDNNAFNFGPTSVDLAAPGVGILSTTSTTNSSYGNLSGTSMATPHAAGAAALLSAFNPNLSPASLKATLMNTVDILPQWTNLVKTGGRLNVDRALRNQTVCNFNLSQTSVSIDIPGGSSSVGVTAPTNCDYSAVSNVNWITVTGGNPGSGNGMVTFTVQANPSHPRMGTITIAGLSLTVVQNGTGDPGFKQPLDFDGDGRTDFSAIQDVSGGMVWHNQRSVAGYSATSFGLFNDDIAVPNDFDGDQKSDIAVWRNSNGTFYVFKSSNNTAQAFQFGLTGDNPNVSQDFDGDNKADFAVTRAQGGSLIWYIQASSAGFRAVQFGNATDKSLRGDYDGDGRADLAVYRPDTGAPANTFFVQRSSTNTMLVQTFGISTTDKTVAADYDGDGRTDFAVWRTTTGVWHYLNSSNGTYNTYSFGISGDLPTPGDYDGDGKSDFAVWRAGANPGVNGIFYVQRSTNGFTALGWGNSTMKIPANSMQSQ